MIFESLVISLLWGLMPVVHRFVLGGEISPYSVMTIGFVAYLLCLIGLFLVKKDVILRDARNMGLVKIALISGTAVVCGFGANLLYYQLIKAHESYLVAALIYSSPMFALLFGWLLLKERVSRVGLIGVLLIVGGVVCLAFVK